MRRILLLMVSVLLVTLNSWGQGFAANAPNVKLETPYFYFDNPDGTIEIYPEYGIKGLENRIMSISSSKYANPLKNVPESDIEREWIMLFFGRKTRTTVFVFDGQESVKAAMMTSSVYTGTIMETYSIRSRHTFSVCETTGFINTPFSSCDKFNISIFFKPYRY